MKLNIGSHNKRIDGYLNVDALDLPNVDIRHYLNLFPYPFEDNLTDEILMMECLEHLSFKITENVLKELYRILTPGGILKLQVPDIGAMCEMYVKNEICFCVPRKAANMAEYKAHSNCRHCGGIAKIHPDRWRVAFSGAQKHPFDNHLAHFTKEILTLNLLNAGFINFEFKDNIYKLIVEAKKL
ncbi:MAG: hypothetical protein UV20_C0009G0040 [Candidatus Magasanikbacteria bacterium GW2011_GWA2_42_32]|uniref:Methyltransferase type 11 domain-containing protein n=1 Tax=Candidatus Magasanikbacteria bacterium GW2011_GWA2_42_32 TaxID=1619039 RepID=A0A0G1CCZ5_9BACT|nr:MAG: hypothetical protein UV20_C0009G0040 [Candidatus Magasanikbacteria bacterium GW2011_GWA2_42_32]HBX15884.1 hypothetical protein [Candidatus Magasanikbacteria bacterium]